METSWMILENSQGSSRNRELQHLEGFKLSRFFLFPSKPTIGIQSEVWQGFLGISEGDQISEGMFRQEENSLEGCGKIRKMIKRREHDS